VDLLSKWRYYPSVVRNIMFERRAAECAIVRFAHPIAQEHGGRSSWRSLVPVGGSAGMALSFASSACFSMPARLASDESDVAVSGRCPGVWRVAVGSTAIGKVLLAEIAVAVG
jgi:hypothetical protein